MKLKRYLIFVILCLALSLISCSSNNKSNVINIYTGIEEDLVEEYISKFHEKYPEIEVNIIRDSTGVISSKLMIEKDNPIADVVWGINYSNILFLGDTDLYKEYSPSNLNEYDERYYDKKHSSPRWIGISMTTVAFTVNEKELMDRGLEVPYSYEDLLKDEYKGLIIMPNPLSSGTGYSIVSSLIQIMGEEKAWDYMDKLNKNIAQYTHSGRAPTKQTATGEYCIGIGMDFLPIKMEKDNPQIKTIFPKEGSGWDVEISALINKKNINKDAVTFYEWSLSDEAMKLYSNNRSLITLKSDRYIKNEYKKVKNSIISNDLNWQSDHRKEIVSKWEEYYGVSE